jgi:hypothetical protein
MELSLRDNLQFVPKIDVVARHPTFSQAKKSDFFTTAEWCLGVLLTVVIVTLLAVRATHAGALWRDECAVVQLSRMPSISDVVRNFQHEAFPPLFRSRFGLTQIYLA